MRKILLNTVFAVVLYVSNTTYAAGPDQDDINEVITRVCQYLPLDDLMYVSRASRICHSIINDRVGPQRYPEFFHLYKAMRTGSWKFEFINLRDSFPKTSTNDNKLDREFLERIHAIDDNGKFIFKKDMPKYPELYFQGPGDGRRHWTGYSVDGETYHGTVCSQGSSKAYVMVVDLKSQPSDLMKNTTGIEKAWIKDDPEETPISVQSFQVLQNPTDITHCRVLGQSANGQFSFGSCHQDGKEERWGFRSTSEKGIKKMTAITENTSHCDMTFVRGLTNSGEITIGHTNTDLGMWVGEEGLFIPIQKFLESGSYPIPDITFISELQNVSANGKYMLVCVSKDRKSSYMIVGY